MDINLGGNTITEGYFEGILETVLSSNDNTISIDTNNRQLIDSSGNVMIDWSDNGNNTSAHLSFQSNALFLGHPIKDNNPTFGFDSIDSNSRQLKDSANGFASVDWDNRLLVDDNFDGTEWSHNSLDWQNRQLVDGGGTNIMADWSGSLNPDAILSFDSGGSLCFGPATRPDSPIEGQTYYDSSAHALYYWNGSAWVLAGSMVNISHLSLPWAPTGVTLSPGAWAELTSWGTAVWDSGDGVLSYSPMSGEITVSKDGFYQVNIRLMFNWYGSDGSGTPFVQGTEYIVALGFDGSEDDDFRLMADVINADQVTNPERIISGSTIVYMTAEKSFGVFLYHFGSDDWTDACFGVSNAPACAFQVQYLGTPPSTFTEG